MNTSGSTAGSIGKVALALAGGLLFPVLVWVALAVALIVRTGIFRKHSPAKQARPAQLATECGSPAKHCWEVLDCPRAKRLSCPTYARRDLPAWFVNELSESRPSPANRNALAGIISHAS